MPAAPESLRRIVVAHAADHVFRGVDAVEQSPEAEESPRKQKLEPDMVEVEVAEHAELKGGVCVPGWGGFGDGDGIDEVDHNFHGNETNQETDAVEKGAG